jgi:hypothetical protein
MGFNIAIYSNDVEINTEDNISIPRSYYYFVEAYPEFKEGSALIQAGNFFNLDTSPLGKFFFADNEFEEEDNKFYGSENEVEKEAEKEIEKDNNNEVGYSQDIDMLIDLVKKLLQGISENPEVFQKVDYTIWDEDIFEDYAASGTMAKDLTLVLQSLQLYKDKGCKTVYFVVI